MISKYIRFSNIILIAVLMFHITMISFGQTPPKSSAISEVLQRKIIAVKATNLAQQYLAKDKDDTRGLTLVKFAKHLYPN